MWLKIGPEHLNLDAASSIVEIEGGYEIQHGRMQYTTVQAIEPKAPKESEGLDAVKAMQKYEYDQEQYLSALMVVEQITGFLAKQETAPKPRARKAKA